MPRPVDPQERLIAPLTDAETLDLVDPSQGRRPREPTPPPEALSDLGNARALVLQHGADLRYVPGQRRWYSWDGHRWARDDGGEAERRAKAVVQGLFTAASVEPDERRRQDLARHALRSASAPRIRSMLELAATEPDVAVTGDIFDPDPYIMTVLNGTIDLRTGELGPHRRDDLVTKLAPVAFDAAARAPRWERFLSEIMQGDDSLVGFLQRMVGYALTGDVREHTFFLLFGTGANGKSTFLETIRAMLGDYARQADFTTFLARRDDAVRADIARLAGARLVTASEAEDGMRFAEALVKQVTGGDTITARRLYQEQVEFRPSFKLLLAANHRPTVWGTDHAFWRRVRLVPFTVTIPPERQDKALGDALQTELPGILNWALAGCRAWLTDGLAEPDAVKGATAEYRAAEDVIGEFLADRTAPGDRGARTSAKDLRVTYEAWCDIAGVNPLGTRAFKARLEERGLARRKVGGTWYWTGLTLINTMSTTAETDDDVPF